MKRFILFISLLSGWAYAQNTAPTMVIDYDNSYNLCYNESRLMKITVTDDQGDATFVSLAPSSNNFLIISNPYLSEDLGNVRVFEVYIEVNQANASILDGIQYTDEFVVTASDGDLNVSQSMVGIILEGNTSLTMSLPSSMCANSNPIDLNQYG